MHVYFILVQVAPPAVLAMRAFLIVFALETVSFRKFISLRLGFLAVAENVNVLEAASCQSNDDVGFFWKFGSVT
jgi:hypothetical protein